MKKQRSDVRNALFFFRSVSGVGFAVVVELAAGPEDATREKIEVDILLHGLVVVA